MMNTLFFAALLAVAATATTGTAAAQDGASPAQCTDPCVPQRLRHAPAGGPVGKPASGEALQRQAMAKLRQRFVEADLDADGALTQDEARNAGLGYVANHFADIDAAHAGKVTFDDVRNYLGKRRRQALGPSAQ